MFSITHSKSGNAAVAASLNAGFTLGAYVQKTTNRSSTDAASGSGSGYIYGSKTSMSDSSSSKSQSYAFYKQGSKESHSASDWGWASESSRDWGKTHVHGSVTEYVNTQAPGTSTASIGSGSLANATGNVGGNIASGIDNAQSNNAALSSIDSGNVFGNAQVYNKAKPLAPGSRDTVGRRRTLRRPDGARYHFLGGRAARQACALGERRPEQQQSDHAGQAADRHGHLELQRRGVRAEDL
ncbi:hypothetical protein [Pararobbsia alpina]|uniref:hypothetical protein n=1 Tax=Pararobbsia alpina TaxID=621374 RepID=UPI00158307EA|nr:hypothetical protein [Pararobbsia alpina]